MLGFAGLGFFGCPIYAHSPTFTSLAGSAKQFFRLMKNYKKSVLNMVGDISTKTDFPFLVHVYRDTPAPNAEETERLKRYIRLQIRFELFLHTFHIQSSTFARIRIHYVSQLR